MRMRHLTVITVAALSFVGCGTRDKRVTTQTKGPENSSVQLGTSEVGTAAGYDQVPVVPVVLPADPAQNVPCGQGPCAVVPPPTIDDCVAAGGCTPVVDNQYGAACTESFINQGVVMPASMLYKTVNVGVSVFGVGNTVSDLQTTIQPVMTILVGVSVLSDVHLLLMNRNAYYCVAVNVGVMSHITVQRACEAKFTGANVNVNVLGRMIELPCVP